MEGGKSPKVGWTIAKVRVVRFRASRPAQPWVASELINPHPFTAFTDSPSGGESVSASAVIVRRGRRIEKSLLNGVCPTV